MATTIRKMSAVRRVAILISTIMIGTICCLWSLSASDPADNFEVLRVVTDTQIERHAVVYRYDHANSSTRTIAVWIVSGQPPNIGSKKPVGGAPALVSPGSVDTFKLRWPRPGERLVAEIDGNVSIRKDKDFQDCYFQYEGKTPLICVDTKQAEVRASADR
jgi:hypothetical protein